MKTFKLILLFLIFGLAASSGSEAAYVFKKIADRSTPIPGASGFNSFFHTFTGVPAVDAGNVAFIGNSIANEPGIYLYNGINLQIVVDDNTVIPGGGSKKFTRFGSPSIWGDKIAFRGAPLVPTVFPELPDWGIYSNALGTLAKVADINTNIPAGTGKFNHFPNEPSLDGGFVAYTGLRMSAVSGQVVINEAGVYRGWSWNAGSVIADTNTTIPGGGSSPFALQFGFFGRASQDGEDVAFSGVNSLSGPLGGIYARILTLNALADTNTNIPGTTSKFTRMGLPSISGTKVAFFGGDNTTEGIYIAPSAGGVAPTKVADTSTNIPGGTGTFTSFGSPSLDVNVLALLGYSSAGGGIYQYKTSDGSLTKIIKASDPLDGKIVQSLDLGPEGLSRPTIAFRVRFTDDSEGIYVADQPVGLLSFPGNTDAVVGLLGSTQFAALPCLLCPANMVIGQAYRFNLALEATGLGITQPIWIDPAIATGFNYKVVGPNFASVTPPTGVDPDETFDLYLWDAGPGVFMDTGITLIGGVSFSFVDNGYWEGVSKFSIRGISPDANLTADRFGYPDIFPVGLTFVDGANQMAEITINAVIYSVTIDIKPGSDTNSINLCSHGVVPVAILGSDVFDASQVVLETIKINGEVIDIRGKEKAWDYLEDSDDEDSDSRGKKRQRDYLEDSDDDSDSRGKKRQRDYLEDSDDDSDSRGKKKQWGYLEDVNNDGYPDLVLHIETESLNQLQGATSATLTGELVDGTSFAGTDTVNIVRDDCLN